MLFIGFRRCFGRINVRREGNFRWVRRSSSFRFYFFVLEFNVGCDVDLLVVVF